MRAVLPKAIAWGCTRPAMGAWPQPSPGCPWGHLPPWGTRRASVPISFSGFCCKPSEARPFPGLPRASAFTPRGSFPTGFEKLKAFARFPSPFLPLAPSRLTVSHSKVNF